MTKQQYIVLAQLLPDKVYWNDTDAALYWIKQPKYQERKGRVIETELLQLCFEAEEKLTGNDGNSFSERRSYINELEIITNQNNLDLIRFGTTHATAEQRITALAKVKGIA
jgi:hypothetical protein